jgi:hypothetical protein
MLLTVVILLSFVFPTANSLCSTPVWGHHELARSCHQNVIRSSVCKYGRLIGDMPEWEKISQVFLIKDLSIRPEISIEEIRVFNMVHVPCINQVHNIQITNKMHFNGYELFWSQFSHQHVSVAIAAIFRVELLQEYDGRLCRSNSIRFKIL